MSEVERWADAVAEDASNRAQPECAVCHMRKKPFGRSAPMEMANGLCDSDCDGYYQNPRAGSMWSNEEPDTQDALEIALAAAKWREYVTRGRPNWCCDDWRECLDRILSGKGPDE